MKFYKLISFALALTLATSCTAQNKKVEMKSGSIAESKGFAVVELFTSEGCSSCPPADKLVGEIQEKYADRNVYVLSYHVDYWNRLGWTDPFSSKEYTQRQYAYAEAMNKNGVYTPQAVINGSKELVGSNGSLESIVQRDLSMITPNTILGKTAIKGDKITADYKVSGDFSGSTLVVNLVKKNATTKVRAGENAGKDLPHTNIVMAMQETKIQNGLAAAELSLPSDFKAKDYSVIAFLQNKKTMKISAATENDF